MVQRIVLMRLKDAAGREALAAECLRVLRAMPTVVRAEAGTRADDDDGWDLSLVVHLASPGDLEPYRVDPDHRRLVDDVLLPRVSAIEAHNFVVAG